MNYRHIFHAGNFGDVLKHAVLTLLLAALKRKEQAYCYLDTHAGIGGYDLSSAPAQKTGEWRHGIGRIWGRGDVPDELRSYLDIVRGYNGTRGGTLNGELIFYPGSPRIARALLRPQDRIVLAELNGDDAHVLKEEFARDPQVAVHHRDGYEALKALLPPKERRGLILIDPPFEQAEELDAAVKELRTAVQRWPTGIFALWYPIKDRPPVRRFHRALQESGLRKVLVVELCVHPDDQPLGLNGSGLVIVNPPWQIDAQLERLLPWLWQALAVAGQGTHRVQWLATE